jgi:hypothetical protein
MTEGYSFPVDFGAGGWAEAKARLEVDNNDAYGCLHLLGGIVMALSFPYLERRGKPHIRLAGSDIGGAKVSSLLEGIVLFVQRVPGEAYVVDYGELWCCGHNVLRVG